MIDRHDVYAFDTGDFLCVFLWQDHITDPVFLGADYNRKGACDWLHQAVKAQFPEKSDRIDVQSGIRNNLTGSDQYTDRDGEIE